MIGPFQIQYPTRIVSIPQVVVGCDRADCQRNNDPGKFDMTRSFTTGGLDGNHSLAGMSIL